MKHIKVDCFSKIFGIHQTVLRYYTGGFKARAKGESHLFTVFQPCLQSYLDSIPREDALDGDYVVHFSGVLSNSFVRNHVV